MGSAFESAFASDALPGLLSEFGKTASLARGTATATPTVIMDMQQVKTRDNQDALISRNWVTLSVPVSQYDFGEGVVEPSAVDEFTVASRKYEARNPDGIGQCWEYTDGTSLVYRIYVEEVAA